MHAEPRWRRTRAAAFALALASVAFPARGQVSEPTSRADRATLVLLTSPVASYSSFKGLEYNAMPLSLERALFDHVGLRLSPSVVVYGRSVQGYGLLLSVPVYLAARAEADRTAGSTPPRSSRVSSIGFLRRGPPCAQAPKRAGPGHSPSAGVARSGCGRYSSRAGSEDRTAGCCFRSASGSDDGAPVPPGAPSAPSPRP